jgi:DNA-binding transcriptional LysR family regulator
MRIEQLAYLTALTQHGSLRQASEHLHVSQSAVSEAISKLERELGVTLLERHRSGARISAEGRDLMPHIAAALDAIERIKVAAGDQLATPRRLRIGTVNAATASLVLPAVRAFQAGQPGSMVEIRDLQQDEIYAGLAERTLDVGLLNVLEGDDLPPELVATPLIRGRLVTVVPAGHRLAKCPEITVDDLRGERFVAMRSGYLMFRLAHRLFGAVAPTDWHSADGAEMGKMMVAEGIGISLLPDYSVLGDPLERAGLIVARPLANVDETITMVSVHRRQPRVPGVVRDLIGFLRAQVESAESARLQPSPQAGFGGVRDTG